MSNDGAKGGIVFHDATFIPGATLLKAADRVEWVALERMRDEAHARVEREVEAALAASCEALERRSDAVVAEQVARLTQAFAHAARELESGAIELALQIAARVIDASPAEAFFARAAEQMQALVPAGASIRLRVHPRMAGALQPLCETLQARGVRHVSVVEDAASPGLRSLVVETPEGEIDLGCATQLRRIAAEIARGAAADEPEASA